MRCCSAVAAVFTVGLLANARSAAAAGPVTMTVSPAGEVSLSLNGRPIANGRWGLRPDSYTAPGAGAEFNPGPIVSATATQDGPTRATLHERHAAIVADYDFDLHGEDLRIAAHVQNTDPVRSIRPLAFAGITFHLNPAGPISGCLPVWHWTYLQAGGVALFHPSVANPIGCWWAGDDRFGFCLHSDSEFDRSAMVVADWRGHDNVIPAECDPNFYTDRAVPPGAAVDVSLTVRITSDRSLPHLLGGYKATFDRRLPLPLYTPDPRPLAQFATIDAAHVSRGNPLGFHEGWVRFDSPRSTAAYVDRTVPQLRRAGCLGTIFWSPGGYAEPMYPPDFDVFPPAVQANIPALVRGFHEFGLRVGLCARCGDGVRRAPGAPPVVYRLSADDPEQMRVEMDRFRHAMRMGFDMFYLDSFGATGLNDVRILRRVRETVGPDVLLYPEYCTDMSLPYADRYCEWTADGSIRWDGFLMYEALKVLCPHATWLCVSEARDAVPNSFAALGLTAIVSDERLRWMPPVPPDHR